MVICLLGKSGFSITHKFEFQKKITFSIPILIRSFDILDKTIYIRASDASIYCTDLNGKTKRIIGRKGKGPGEFVYISDFCLTHKKLFITEGHKISVFDLQGKLQKEYKIKEFVLSMTVSNKELIYISNKFNFKKRTSYLNLRNLKNTLIASFADETRVNARLPSGKIVWFPWMVAPYPNKMFCITGNDGILRIFFTRKNFFYVINNGRLQKKIYKFKFKTKLITKKDKNDFWNQIEKGSRKKFPRSTKVCVTFPEKKPLFIGAISWDIDFALLQKDHFIIISKNGDFKFRVNFPKALDNYKSGDPNLFISKMLKFINNSIYFSNEEDLFVYDLIKTK